MLLTSLQWTGQPPPPQNNHSVQNTNSTQVEKPLFQLVENIRCRVQVLSHRLWEVASVSTQPAKPLLCYLDLFPARAAGKQAWGSGLLTCILRGPSFELSALGMSPALSGPQWHFPSPLAGWFWFPRLIHPLPVHCVVVSHNWGGFEDRWQEKKKKKEK